jgi:hypothetical protein
MNLVRCKSQVGQVELDHLAARPKVDQRQVRILPGGDDQAQL